MRVYDAAGISETDVADATATAQRILAAAGVATEWVACGGQTERCARPLGPAEVTVRLVAISIPDHYRGSLPMGDAMVDTAARGGSLATIYANRVTWLARAGQSDARVLLGRAIAHEIGHLLLGTTGHAAHGLMRARWSEHEVRQPVAVDWLFTSGDARRMQEKLARLVARSQWRY